jgi:hypothetical protein
MISALREIRLSRAQTALVAALSALATGLIIHSALGRTAAQSAAMTALRHPPQEIRVLAPAPTPAAAPAPAPAAPAPVDSANAATSDASSSATSPTTTYSSGTTPTTTPSSTPPSAARKTPRIRHVFLIALSTTSFDAAFGQVSAMRYLNHKLRPQGALLGAYQTLGRQELPDYLALISGQAPNPDTEGDCPTYAEFASAAKPNAAGQVRGAGCIYPNTALTLGDQVTSSGHTWKAYIQGMGSSACAHPNSDALDSGAIAGAGPDYDTRHNPFIYFHSLLDLGDCASDDVSLSALPGDLRSVSSTPALAYIAPGACLDVAVQAATCPDGQPGGLAGENLFLKHWVPKILHSPAYKRDGVLIITFAAAIPGSQPGPAPSPDTSVPTGALVLSRYAARGATITATSDAYSILRSIEDLLGYKPLGMAKSAKSIVASALPGVG